MCLVSLKSITFPCLWFFLSLSLLCSSATNDWIQKLTQNDDSSKRPIKLEESNDLSTFMSFYNGRYHPKRIADNRLIQHNGHLSVAAKDIPSLIWNKFKRNEEAPPPGFVGARGRRIQLDNGQCLCNNGPCLCNNGRREKRQSPSSIDNYKSLNEIFPNLLSRFSRDYDEGTDMEITSLPWKQTYGKKSDDVPYKDGFLGVRG